MIGRDGSFEHADDYNLIVKPLLMQPQCVRINSSLGLGVVDNFGGVVFKLRIFSDSHDIIDR